MDALVVVFIAGLGSLFLGMLKKPVLALLLNLLGLSVGFILLMNYNSYVPLLKSYSSALVFNGPQLYFGMMAILFTALVLIFGFKKQSEDVPHYADITSLMMFSLTGALCLIGFKDFFMFFIGLEILSIPVYVLVGSQKSNTLSSEASLKYFFTGSFGTALLLFGIALIFGGTGSFNLNEIGYAVLNNMYIPSLFIPGVLLIIAALLFKIGAVPFHFWNPDVYQGSSKPVMAYMATVVKIAGFVAAYKLISNTFGIISEQWMYFMYIVIIASLFLGYLSGFKQQSLKRLLAFSGISNTGIGLLAILNGTSHSELSLIVFLLGYGASTLILLTVAQLVSHEEDDIAALEGIGYTNPILGIALLFSLLSLSGIPPFTGFFGKFYLIQDILVAHPVIAFAAIVSSVLGAYIYLKLILHVFSSKNRPDKIILNPLSLLVIFVGMLILLAGWLWFL